ncbi:MAG: hypothetical protein IAX21_04835 [Candidatus Bathyarchaeota archaeon]|nr:MAG: hypothetical protein IAX21_04835 [Candidatus Bathyarchaeota archaeon]
MQKKAIVLVFAFLISFATTGVPAVKPQYTESGEGFPLASPITITSPENSTYNSNELNLGVNCKFLLSPNYAQVSYSIDGKENGTIPLTGTQKTREVTRTYANGTTVVVNSTLMVPLIINGSVALPELTDGPHNITVNARYNADNIMGLDSSIVYFTINHSSLNQNIETISEFPEWTPLLIVVFIVLVMVILYKYILNKLEE